MKTINTIEHEVNNIRLAIYEKIKDMIPAQITEYYRKSGEAIAKKFGLKIIERANALCFFFGRSKKKFHTNLLLHIQHIVPH